MRQTFCEMKVFDNTIRGVEVNDLPFFLLVQFNYLQQRLKRGEATAKSFFGQSPECLY